MNIKVLKLEYWMDHNDFMFKETIESGRYEEISPVFNRDGIYLYQSLCWFEVGEKAYIYPINTFKYKMKMEEAKKYNDKQIKALVEVNKQGLATKEQKQIIHDHACMMETIWVGRRARMAFNTFTKKRRK